ncbi:multicopper oxidase domain-containing protein [Ammoniphilus sp. 3BR4]|uniref:multicopper oxidase domain-containing protein n=1 Tax=Ammoniphilus sp. 3BR4 TaxID=3158265 RepID=UPI003464FD34
MDEWASSAATPEGQGNPHAMAGMEQGGSQGDHMANYDLVSVNGKAEEAIEPLVAKKGELVRLRFLNSGNIRRTLHLLGHQGKIISFDGQPVEQEVQQDIGFTIAPGERVDVLIRADKSGDWAFKELRDGAATNNHSMTTFIQSSKPLRIPFRVEGELASTGAKEWPKIPLPERPALPAKFEKTYTMTLTEKMVQANGNMETV